MRPDTFSLPSTLKELPWFTYADAKKSGVPRQSLYRLRDEGEIAQLARGIYQATDSSDADPSLIAAAALRPEATLCLQSALARHDLTDEIPRMIDLALPRGRRHPRINGPIRWHSFDADTFEIGRTEIEIARGIVMGIYTPERCIIDAFRLRGREGYETANEALKRWLKRSGSQPSTLLRTAQMFPRTIGPLRQALEILL
jgi:predicted transcriptional regulator of viral defense system